MAHLGRGHGGLLGHGEMKLYENQLRRERTGVYRASPCARGTDLSESSRFIAIWFGAIVSQMNTLEESDDKAGPRVRGRK